jgi:hypothetical protein
MRTFAMRVYAATYWLLAALFLYILAVLILPMLAKSPEVAAFLPIILVFLGLFVLGAGLATFLPSAPRRRWLWLGFLVPPILFLLLNAPFIPFALSHPTDTAFTAIMPLVVGSVVLLWAGITAFREAGPDPQSRTGRRAPWAVALVAGATIGAFLTSYVAAAGGGGGAAIAAIPTTTAIQVAEGTKYLTTSYEMTSSDVLGLFVVNKDSFAHSFDIDSLNVHVQVPANATVAVAIKPTGAGTLEFYCSIPGHKEAGMAGTVTVH